MQTRLTIDEAGRITLPPKLHLHLGDTLELDTEDGAITLRPANRLRRKQGVWVLDTDEPITAEMTNRLMEEIRMERDLANLGLSE